MTTKRPTKAELEAARALVLDDVIAPDLDVLFCGINPGLYSAAVGCHFGRPGNRFWPVLHGAGFTDRVLRPDEQHELLQCGCGITNLVARTTAAAVELNADEMRRGVDGLVRKIRRYRPKVLAVLGIGAYGTGFGAKHAKVGRQAEAVGGSDVWVLPNPSGRAAHYQLPDLIRLFAELRTAVK